MGPHVRAARSSLAWHQQRLADREARLVRLQTYLATLQERPTQLEIGAALGVATSTVSHYLALLEARGVVVPPRVTWIGPGIVRASICQSLQDGRYGWCVSIKQPRTNVWLADRQQALAVQQLLRDGKTVAQAMAVVQEP